MSKRDSCKDRRAVAADLAVQSGASMEDPAHLLASCIFFENWIELGGDETQRRMRLLPEASAELHMLKGGKA